MAGIECAARMHAEPALLGGDLEHVPADLVRRPEAVESADRPSYYGL